MSPTLKNISNRIINVLSISGLNANRDPNEIANLTKKLEYLDNTGRYSSLLSDFLKCNDINNFKSIIVEATFAYSFESVKIPLYYEIAQSLKQNSTVDFLLKSHNGKRIFFEICVNQQQKLTHDQIESQLKLKSMYSISMNGTDVQKDIIRLQSNILSKIQDKHGNPIKFFITEQGVYNIVTVDISEMILGRVGKNDCMLTSYGDPYVEEPFKMNIFGLFQEPDQNYPNYIIEISKDFSVFRKTIHGILFLFRYPISGPLDFELRYHLIPNINLMSQSDIEFLDKEIMNALTPWDDG